jgi:putative hydrolase of the HAD superfamily
LPLLLTDLDDTLIDRVGAFRRWLLDFAGRYGVGEEQFDWVTALDNDGFVDRTIFFEEVRARLGLAPTIDDLLAEYHRQYPAFVEPPPEATFAALRRLRASGWHVGVVTNGPPSQMAKMANARLLDELDCWCVSSLVGVRKPDPAIFRLAAERCGAALEGGWMVGDAGHADIAGAVASGISSVWIRRGREWSLPEFRPTATADSFAEAVDLIQPHR